MRLTKTLNSPYSERRLILAKEGPRQAQLILFGAGHGGARSLVGVTVALAPHARSV